MSKPITVVTITYNAIDLIEQTLKSVVEQAAKKSIEYIVIDGGSTDGTIDIVNKYKDHINVFISEPDNGIYDAMNKSIALVTGKWVNFMNSGDTFADKNSIEEVIKHLNDGVEILYGEYNIVDSDYKVIELGNTIHVNKLNEVMKNRMPFCHQSVFTKAELLKKYRFDDTFALAADYDFFMKCLYNGHSFNHINTVVSHYLEGGRSESLELKATIEAVKAYSSYYNTETIKASTVYKRFIELRNIKQEKLIKSLEEKLNEKNAEITSFYNDKVFKIAKLLTYPVNKYKLIRAKK